jgi:hypothetical protein
VTVAIFGGYGTFGTQVARTLAGRGLPLRILGRDGEVARSLAVALGKEHAGAAADANDLDSCIGALAGARVAVSCAGPFQAMSLALPEACLAAGVHYVDIADDRAWFARLRTLDGRFRAAGLAAVAGASSLPGISGALAVLAAERLPAVERARVTLFIGNRNPKGPAAVTAAAAQVGRRFAAPQGTLRGFAGREVVRLPPPFGARGVYDFESPELDLFPELTGAREVRVKVGFESRLATAAFAGLARLGPHVGPRLVRSMSPLAGLLSRFGHSGGAVQVELFAPGGRCAAAFLSGAEDGQRMAALPAAFVAQGLYGGFSARGVVTAYEALGARALLEKLAAEGFMLVVS